jgi:hypothetical protein
MARGSGSDAASLVASVSLYGSCGNPNGYPVIIPLLALSAGNDDWTPRHPVWRWPMRSRTASYRYRTTPRLITLLMRQSISPSTNWAIGLPMMPRHRPTPVSVRLNSCGGICNDVARHRGPRMECQRRHRHQCLMRSLAIAQVVQRRRH